MDIVTPLSRLNANSIYLQTSQVSNVLKTLRLEFSDYKVLSAEKKQTEDFNIVVLDKDNKLVASCNQIDGIYAVVKLNTGKKVNVELK